MRLDVISLATSLADVHPGVRRHAVRLCEGRLEKWSEMAAKFAKLIDDADPQVRLQLAYSLGEWNDAKAGPMLAKLVLAAQNDPYFLAAVFSSVNKSNLDAVIAEVMAANPAPKLIVPLLTSAGRPSKAVARVLIAALAKPSNGKYSLDQLQSLANVLDAIHIPGFEIFGDAIQQAAPLLTYARQQAANEKAPHAERIAAIRLLRRDVSHGEEDLETLTLFLAPQTPDDLQAAAVDALSNPAQVFFAKRLLEHWKNYSPSRRTQVLQVLMRREEGIAYILHALGEKKIDPNEIDTPSRQRLLTDKSIAVRNRAEKLFAMSIDADRQKVIDAYQPVLTLKGDAGRGKESFAKSCSNCHRLNGVGNEVGPDLAALAGRSVEYLLVQVLDPNRAVEARYVNYLLETKGGVSLTGVLLNESSTSVTIVGTDGKPQTILRTNLEALTSTGRSAMPDGLEKDLPHQALADVLAYVRSSKPATKPKQFAGNKPELLKPAADGRWSCGRRTRRFTARRWCSRRNIRTWATGAARTITRRGRWCCRGPASTKSGPSGPAPMTRRATPSCWSRTPAS